MLSPVGNLLITLYPAIVASDPKEAVNIGIGMTLGFPNSSYAFHNTSTVPKIQGERSEHCGRA